MAGEQMGPLVGVKVLDLSTIIAGGTATSMLADFGAEVIKVEQPRVGDALRRWGPFYPSRRGSGQDGASEAPENSGQEDVSVWWKVHSRNKKSITLDLRRAEGQGILKKLAKGADVLVEGFRPGTLERWGLAPDELSRINPNLIIVRFSGYGQTGPYKDRPGFGTVAECMSGMVAMSGFPDTPPMLPPVPLGDEVAGLFGAMASVMALHHRDADASGKGQVVDVSLFEPLFRLAIPYVTLYDLLNIVRHRVGNEFPDAAPRTMLKTTDERWVGLSATTQATWEDLARAIGRPELIDDPRFIDNPSRVANRDELNVVLQGWMSDKTLEQVMDLLVPAGGVVGPVYDIAQIVADPHYRARDDIIEVDDADLGTTKMVGVVPKFSSTPGEVVHGGPALGEHNYEVYGEWLGLTLGEVDRLREAGVV